MSTGWMLGGVNLRTLGYDISTTDGWDSIPALKNPRHEPGYRHGYFVDNGGRWVYRDRDIIIGMTLLPVDAATGTIISSPTEHIEEHIETLAEIMYTNDGSPILLQKTTPSGLIKTINVVPESLQAFVEHTKTSRRVSLILNAPYPFWHGGVLDQNPGLSGSFALTNNGTAPINDMVIAFNAAATLTHVPSGAQIVAAAGGITLDIGRGSDGLISGSHDDVSVNKPWIMEMIKGSNSFTSTGSVDIDYYHGYLT